MCIANETDEYVERKLMNMAPGIDSQAKRTDAYCVAKKADEHKKRKLTQITEETGADAKDRRKISCGNGWVSQKGRLCV